MIKYTNNEQYERDKAALIRIAKGNIVPLIENADVIAELLKQSKWIGDVDDVVDNSASVKPIPVKKDKFDRLTKDYDIFDWLGRIDEELDEVKSAATAFDSAREDITEELQERKKALAMELQDLITVCTSCLDFLGFDEAARDKLCQQINEKNRKRGYFEEDQL